MEAPLAAVTGGTGFLGRHLVAALLADGWRVRALVRRSPGDASWPEGRVELVAGDLDDAGSLERLCRGAQAVVHAAGAIKARRRSTFEAVNVTGAAATAAAAARAAAPGAAFVLVSSLAAREPGLSAYAQSKRRGEDAVRRALGEAACVARPCALYGPGDRETLALFRAASGPVAPVLAPRARVCLMHGADAGRALAALARAPAAGVVELSDARPQGYGWREIMSAAAQAVGARPRQVRVPAAAIRALGLLGDVGRRLGASPMLTSGKARELLHEDWSVGAATAAPAPEYDLARGFSQTVAWYRARGWLPPAQAL
ncbi:MAG: NAD-dependent epimerase/dehydratase family protein [Caulobacteraceae bacterium]|nr:NAD-dependent epimerase/dehydratase family protein [Caulobacter sp.]